MTQKESRALLEVASSDEAIFFTPQDGTRGSEAVVQRVLRKSESKFWTPASAGGDELLVLQTELTTYLPRGAF